MGIKMALKSSMKHSLSSLSYSVLALSFFMITCSRAALPLPLQRNDKKNAADGTAFGGAFQVSGSACGNSCTAGNLASSSTCTCPASAPLPAFFETATDCKAPFAASRAYLCFAGASVFDGVGLGGVFQIDDISGACRSPNLFTMACSCPTAYTTWRARVLVVNDGPLLGTVRTARRCSRAV